MLARSKSNTQELQSFTVQICKPNNGEIIGTGFVVAPDGMIATCVHVVRDAESPTQDGRQEVEIYFPQTRARLMARVLPQRQLPEDDVAILQLNSKLPEGVSVALLGSSAGSTGHQFSSYGFRPLPPYEGGPAHGIILDRILRAPDSLQRFDPLLLRSPEINRGMSGSPVLDLQTNRVVGLIAATWESGGKLKDRDTAFAAPAEALTQLIPNITLTPHQPRATATARNLSIAGILVLLLAVLSVASSPSLQRQMKLAFGLSCGKTQPDAFGYERQGKEFRDEGEYECARRDFELGIKSAVTDSERAQLYYDVVTVVLAEVDTPGVEDEALALIQKGLEYNAKHPLLHLSKGIALCRLEHNPESATALKFFLDQGGNLEGGDFLVGDVETLYEELTLNHNLVSRCNDLSTGLP